MLSDRPYMRSDYPRETTSALTWFLSAVIAGSVMQLFFERFLGSNVMVDLLAVTPGGVLSGKVWTLVTYTFLHGGVLHLVLNALGLFLIGREIAPLLGTRGLAQFLLSTAILGALAWFAVHAWGSPTFPLVGASAVLAGMFIFFACVAPEREITFLLFFVLPVTLKPKLLAWILLGIDGLGFLFNELPGGALDGGAGIAHSAHLGGMLAGWLYFRLLYANNGLDRAAGPSFKFSLFRRSTKASTLRASAETPAQTPPVNLRAEVDRILDKINSHGFGALTEQEKRLLDDAKDLLSRR
ncbi:MAG TPA: rhomboid family intramembrane serine protease, partial [Acidobacteriota bacterium]|nr:rhomboid family intramembrane serine protease [Acidobacteriota bacterium]